MTTYRYPAYKRDWRLIAGDTLLPLLCLVLGHNIYDSNAGGSPEWACKRCHHFVQQPEKERGE